MLDILKNKRVLALVAAFALVIGGLLVFGRSEPALPAVPGSPAAPYLSIAPLVESPASPALGQELLAALALLKTISLDTAFFDDAAYRSLSDWSKVVPPQPVGRRNPFAPLSAGAGAAPAAPSGQASGSGRTGPLVTPPPPSVPPEDLQPSSDADVWDFSEIEFSF